LALLGKLTLRFAFSFPSTTGLSAYPALNSGELFLICFLDPRTLSLLLVDFLSMFSPPRGALGTTSSFPVHSSLFSGQVTMPSSSVSKFRSFPSVENNSSCPRIPFDYYPKFLLVPLHPRLLSLKQDSKSHQYGSHDFFSSTPKRFFSWPDFPMWCAPPCVFPLKGHPLSKGDLLIFFLLDGLPNPFFIFDKWPLCTHLSSEPYFS